MKFTREMPTSLTVRRVEHSLIQVGDQAFECPIAITPAAVEANWPVEAIADLTVDDFADLLESQPEVILLGTGASFEMAPRALVFDFARLGVGFEVMDSGAAARTFNVLAGEGRQVVAVLYLD